MAQVSNYQLAGQILNEERNLDSVERKLAAAQTHATLAVADQIYDLTQQIQRLVAALEGIQGSDIAGTITASTETLRQQIRSVAGV
ncbi:hypothetical protein [Actinoplanes sp. NPDC051494]|uniref:hypothetical protein n=1 Tax=Actinoplanes sp. NPDC051494 TaxID=3363907 RepID=UPI0037951708